MSTKHILCNFILMRSKGHLIILADPFNEMLLIKIFFVNHDASVLLLFDAL